MTITLDRIEAALVAAVPGELIFSLERSDDTIFVTLPQQPGIPWELHFGWEGVIGEGEYLLSIFSDPLKYEELYLDSVDQEVLHQFGTFVRDLLRGEIAVELTRFRSTGKLWRTRLVDHRQPDGEQMLYSYYRHALRWWRPVVTTLVRLGRRRSEQAEPTCCEDTPSG